MPGTSLVPARTPLKSGGGATGGGAANKPPDLRLDDFGSPKAPAPFRAADNGTFLYAEQMKPRARKVVLSTPIIACEISSFIYSN